MTHFTVDPSQLMTHLHLLLNSHPHIHRLIVGYSGGMDSHVLLHCLATNRELRKERIVEAVYVNHGLQAASTIWSEHCARVCKALDVPFQILKVNAQPSLGESPEAAARNARYTVLAAELDADVALLTAHHRDDQAETVLLQLLRGAGVHGLAAMPMAARLGQGWLLRPLLDIDRAELLDYAHAHHLQWIEDASNANTDFDRNYLRHQVLPLLRERWSATNRTLARSARWCAETASWLDTEAAADLARIVTDRRHGLSIPSLLKLSEPRQRNLIRYWLRDLGLPIPDARQLSQLLHDMLNAGRDRQPCVRWAGGETRRYQDILYAMSPLKPHDAQREWVWRDVTKNSVLELAGVGQLKLQKTIGAGLRTTLPSETALTVRFRKGGERFHPAGRHHSQALKKLLQEAGIPPWERDRLPLLYQGDTLLAVVGLGVAADYVAAPNEAGWLIVLESLSAMWSGIV